MQGHISTVTCCFILSLSTCAQAGIKANWVILTEIRVHLVGAYSLPAGPASMRPSATEDTTCDVHCAHKGMSSYQQHLDWVSQVLEILLPPQGKLEPLRVLDLSAMIVVLEIVLSFMFLICRPCILICTSKYCDDNTCLF